MLFFWTFYALNNPEKKIIVVIKSHSFQNLKQHNCSTTVFNIDNNMFIEQQISILEWFLKDHVTLE